MNEGFFSRWSRRKRDAGQLGGEADGSAAGARDGAEMLVHDEPSHALRDEASIPSHGLFEDRDHPHAAHLPTLEDVHQLSPDADFQPFMQRGVGAEVRNAAMKKLFTDPHFNVMDGLDIYIDDYSQPDPMPAGMLRQMASAQFLKLVPDEGAEPAPGLTAQNLTPAGVAGPHPEVVAQSPDSSAKAEPPRHEYPDLQLQPDPSPADPSAGSHPG